MIPNSVCEMAMNSMVSKNIWLSCDFCSPLAFSIWCVVFSPHDFQFCYLPIQIAIWRTKLFIFKNVLISILDFWLRNSVLLKFSLHIWRYFAKYHKAWKKIGHYTNVHVCKKMRNSEYSILHYVYKIMDWYISLIFSPF